jgi:hypothetical protein
MDKKEITERIRYFENIAAKYGYSTVPAPTVYQVFEEIAQPGRLGFATIRSGLYGKAVNSEIVHLVKLQALKGMSYTVWWGVSLSFVPHKWNCGLRWHRAFKSSRFDLFETPFDYFPLAATEWRESEKYIADTLHGESYLKRSLDVMWKGLGQELLAWFTSTQSLDGVLQKAREQTERNWVGFNHHPDPLMVYAFTLVRLGQTEEARAAITRYFHLGLEPLEAQENLKKAMEKIRTG